MVLYNILLGILVILSTGLICIGLIQEKILGDELIYNSITKGMLGILAIISICLSRYLIHIDELPMMHGLNNLLTIVVTLVIFISYICTITNPYHIDNIGSVFLVILTILATPHILDLATPHILDFIFKWLC